MPIGGHKGHLQGEELPTTSLLSTLGGEYFPPALFIKLPTHVHHALQVFTPYSASFLILVVFSPVEPDYFQKLRLTPHASHLAIAMPSTITLVLGFVAATYVFLSACLRLTQDPKEPPAIETSIPFLSPLYGVILGMQKFTVKLRSVTSSMAGTN